MIRFECDYGEGAAQPVLDLLQKTNLEQTPGYGEDEYCEQARALIRRLCANYDEGNCLALDEGEGCVCVQSISYSLLCRYFKESVLPADAELCAAIGQGADDLKRCRSCGKPFQARSNRALYCPRCAAFEQRKKARERVRRYRGQM